MFETAKHKATLLQAFSDCFDPMRSDLGNVHPRMRQSRYITASILGVCRGYADSHQINEKIFNLLVDSVFEEVFRSESITMQSKTETWLQSDDKDFMTVYYEAKARTHSELDLSWLSEYAQASFKKARTLQHPL